MRPGRIGVSLILKCPAFNENGFIPKAYTGDGENNSPDLSWVDAPAGTKEFALICEDPDAPGKTFIHWVIYKIPSSITDLRQRMPDLKVLPGGGIRQGVNDFGRIGYSGPRPPHGSPHRYYFKLYALSEPIELEAGATAAQLEKAMRGYVLEEAQLMGKYQR
jgi:Raf kinase inhibitor-like YbhB/YbcL family protein